MRFTNDGKTFSATDLSSHSECEHRTLLEIGVAVGKWKRPGQSEIRTELLEMRGREHEARVYAHCDSKGQRIATVSDTEADAVGERVVRVLGGGGVGNGYA